MTGLAWAARKIGLGLRPEDDITMPVLDWVEDQLTRPKSAAALVTIDAAAPEVAEWPADRNYDLDERIRRIQQKRATEFKIDAMNLAEEERRRLWEENALATDVHDIDICRFCQVATWGDDQVRQRLTHFWLNHFTVGWKDMTNGVIGHYWDMIYEAIDGSFADLAYRTTTHPAMLMYLDNTTNVGPRSEHGRNCNCGDGLNDNLARELMELHTVSPARGYTEADIHEAAKVLSGWGDIFELAQNWKKPPADWTQAWVSARAEPGEKAVLGQTIPAGREGLRVLVDTLAADEHTRRFVSGKLAYHFIGEEATEADIAAIADAWEASGGHLPSIHRVAFARALESPEKRFHWPLTWLFQTLRLSGASLFSGFADVRHRSKRPGPSDPWDIMRELGNSFWSERQPNGFSDLKADWVSTEHLDRRYRFATVIAAFGKPMLGAEEIIERHGFSETTRELVSHGTSPTEKFILLACSPEFMEV